MAGLIIGIVAAIALLAWLVRRGEGTGRPKPYRPAGDIDYAELEAAEREVRDLGISAIPGEENPGDDWGPGTARPRGPNQL